MSSSFRGAITHARYRTGVGSMLLMGAAPGTARRRAAQSAKWPASRSAVRCAAGCAAMVAAVGLSGCALQSPPDVRQRAAAERMEAAAAAVKATYTAGMSLLRVQTEQRVQRVQLHLALGGDMAAPAR